MTSPRPTLSAAWLSLRSTCCSLRLGFNERFKDHYLVAPQIDVSMVFLLAFAYFAPEVGMMFLCTLFVVFGFGSLRTTPRQTAMIWTAMALGLAGLFLLTDKPIAMPHGNYLERFATMSVFILTIGRCMFLGIFSSAMHQSLYQSGLKLKEAYKRIEELAELDELTGSFNRRCIMRMLDEEIARAGSQRTPCSIALIDLDWFKRINDAYGHPTGDEVLQNLRHHHVRQYPQLRPVRPLRRRGIPAGAARIRLETAPRASSTGCASSSPISTGARSRRTCR